VVKAAAVATTLASNARLAPPRFQRGAAAVFVAISLIALLTATGLAIELGRVYNAQRQLQKAATLAALDASRVVSGCTAGATRADFDNAVNASVARNYNYGSFVATGDFGTVQTVASLRSLLPTSSIAQANAARVTLTAPFPKLLFPYLPQRTGVLIASATATQEALGSLRIGSGVADVNLSKSLLSALLGGSVNVVDYNGLAGVNVTAQQLATALGVSVADLADPLSLSNTVVLGAALNGLASALGGTVSSQVRNSLQNLAGQATNNTPIPLSGILGPISNVASDVPFVSLQDVFMALALASRANPIGNPTPIQLNGLNVVALPGVANVSVFAKVIEPPKLSNLGRAGPLTDARTAQASTAQVRLMIRIDGSGGLLSSLNLINIPFVAQVTAVPSLKIGIDVEVAKATAWLNSLTCPVNGTNNGLPVAGLDVNTAVATVAVGTYNNTTDAVTPGSSIPLATVKLLGITLANLALGIDSSVAQTASTLNDVTQFRQCKRNGSFPSVCDDTDPASPDSKTPIYRALGAPGMPTVPAASPSTENPQKTVSNLGINLNLKLTGGSSLVGAVLTPITNLITPLLNLVNTTLLTAVINPLLDLLGVSAGTATVTMDLVTVGQPVVVTTTLP
jgi:uncharacterized membrane protein